MSIANKTVSGKALGVLMSNVDFEALTADSGQFTTLTVAGVTYTVGTAALNGGTIAGAAINSSTIGTSTALAGSFTTLISTTANLGALESTIIGSGTAAAANFTTLTSTATASIGASATALVGFHGKAPVSAAASIIPVGATQGAIGFDTTAHASAAIDAINAIITAIKNIGITV